MLFWLTYLLIIKALTYLIYFSSLFSIFLIMFILFFNKDKTFNENEKI